MATGPGVFSQEQFLQACTELQKPAVAGANWQLLLESLHIRIYQLVNQTGLYQYKVFVVLEDCPPAVLADVCMDLDYRNQRDQHVKELYEKKEMQWTGSGLLVSGFP